MSSENGLTPGELTRALRQSGTSVLMDALDERPTAVATTALQRQASDAIANLREVVGRTIVSARTYAWDSKYLSAWSADGGSRAAVVELAKLDEGQRRRAWRN